MDLTTPVIIVETHRVYSLLIEGMLREIGFHKVETTLDPSSALSNIQEGGTGLVIAELHVEPMSGLELLRMVRADRRLDRLPFLVTTQNLSPWEARALKNGGVDGILLKPFTRNILEPKLNAAFERNVTSRRTLELSATRNLSTALGRRFRYRRPS